MFFFSFHLILTLVNVSSSLGHELDLVNLILEKKSTMTKFTLICLKVDFN